MEKSQLHPFLSVIPIELRLNSQEKVSSLFHSKGINTFGEACQWVAALPYKRISNISDISAVFVEECGTCSSKHALLKLLAEENQLSEIKLMIGIFRMTKAYSIKLEPLFNQYHLDYIPEAHCYLNFEGKRYDFTTLTSKVSDFEEELMYETEINADEIFERKVELHKNFLNQWLGDNKNINYTLAELWNIRELCIEALSK